MELNFDRLVKSSKNQQRSERIPMLLSPCISQFVASKEELQMLEKLRVPTSTKVSTRWKFMCLEARGSSVWIGRP